jgi:hypothetical protein
MLRMVVSLLRRDSTLPKLLYGVYSRFLEWTFYWEELHDKGASEALCLMALEELASLAITHATEPVLRSPIAELTESLWSWRRRCAYNQKDDWVFASPHGKGKQPYWPNSLCRVYLRPALEAIGITAPVGWRTLRHSFGTLMKANGEDIKTIQ